jgi:hypothetical protein
MSTRKLNQAVAGSCIPHDGGVHTEAARNCSALRQTSPRNDVWLISTLRYSRGPCSTSQHVFSMADDPMMIEDSSSLSDHLFNTTFSTHRVTPLFVAGKRALNEARLRVLSQRLRATLVGDVVRGVEVGLDGAVGDETLGALEVVEVKWVDAAPIVGHGDDESSRALLIFMRYESVSCSALLLPRGMHDGEEQPAAVSVDFLHLPLLLLRMPASLKPFVIDWISSTFDCRISSLRLGTRTLVRCFESWLRDVGAPSRGALAKDAVLTLEFFVQPTETKQSENGQLVGDDAQDENSAEANNALAIKSIDVIVPAADLGRFAQGATAPMYSNGDRKTAPSWASDMTKRRKLAGGKEEEGWAWLHGETMGDGSQGKVDAPFMNTLARYLDQNLALNLFHPGVSVTKIACAGFVISETRLKLFRPPALEDGVEEVNGNALKPIQSLLADITPSTTRS